MARDTPFDAVRRLLQEQGLGFGLTNDELAERYPTGQTGPRLIAALRQLEEMGHVRAWTSRGGRRYRWVGPLPDDARPFGQNWARLRIDLCLSPGERVALAVELSESLLPHTRRTERKRRPSGSE